jgi:alkylation response protein AidB-like acyl-CoA dehydrogenase
MNTFDTDEKLKRFLPRGVEGEIGEWLSTATDIGEDGGDAKTDEFEAVGSRRRTGRLFLALLLNSDSTSMVSSSGMTSSCLEWEGLVALPGMKCYIFAIDREKK